MKIKIFWNKTICLLSDIFYYLKGDRSTAYESRKRLGVSVSFRHYARNPMCGIFKKILF
jgi:hypothetical protein